MSNEIKNIIEQEVDVLEKRLANPGLRFTNTDFNNRLYGFLKALKVVGVITSEELSDIYIDYSK